MDTRDLMPYDLVKAKKDTEAVELHKKTMQRLYIGRLIKDDDFLDFVFGLLKRLHCFGEVGLMSDYGQGRFSVGREIIEILASADGGSECVGKLTTRLYKERKDNNRDGQ